MNLESLTPYLPSKKSLIAFIILSATGMGYFAWDYFYYQKPIETALNDTAGRSAYLSAKNKDRDHDGLADWEELLFSMNPDNPDTDGDGMLDGEEVGRLSINGSIHGESSSSSPILTETEKFAREIGSVAIGLSAGGKDTIIASGKDVGTALAKKVQDEMRNMPDAYAFSNIRISSDSTDALKAYGNELIKVLAGNLIPETESSVLARIIKDPNRKAFTEKELENLQRASDAYRKDAAGFLALSVPRSAAFAHLLLINASVRLSSDVEKMKLAFTDPLVSLIVLNQYIKDEDNIRMAMEDIRMQIINSKITYDIHEPGYIFTNVSWKKQEKQLPAQTSAQDI